MDEAAFAFREHNVKSIVTASKWLLLLLAVVVFSFLFFYRWLIQSIVWWYCIVHNQLQARAHTHTRMSVNRMQTATEKYRSKIGLSSAHSLVVWPQEKRWECVILFPFWRVPRLPVSRVEYKAVKMHRMNHRRNVNNNSIHTHRFTPPFSENYCFCGFSLEVWARSSLAHSLFRHVYTSHILG